jgi:hypothetical protein
MFRPVSAIFVFLLAVLLGGCASTSLVNQWKSADYTGGPIRKVMVVGVNAQPSVRRSFEDEFAAKLNAAGVEAIPSYTVIREDGKVDQAVLESAVQKAGADGVLIARLVKREQETQVTAGSYGPTGVYGGYSSAWMGSYEMPTVHQYDVVTIETSLYSTQQSKLVWSGTTETFAPTDVRKETARYADAIIGALRKQGVI